MNNILRLTAFTIIAFFAVNVWAGIYWLLARGLCALPCPLSSTVTVMIVANVGVGILSGFILTNIVFREAFIIAATWIDNHVA